MEEDGAFSFAPLPHLPSVVCLHVWLFSGEKRRRFFSYSALQMYGTCWCHSETLL